MTSSEKRAREIQDAIREVLLRDWDPIGVRDVPEAQDEYDGYVGGIYRLLAAGTTDAVLAEHLARIERESMGLRAHTPDRLEIASRLMRIDIAIGLA